MYPALSKVLSEDVVETEISTGVVRDVMKNTTEKELDALSPLPPIYAIHDGLWSHEGTRAEPRPYSNCGTPSTTMA